MPHLTLLKGVSVLVCVLLAVGVVHRRRRRVHIPLMLSAFGIDLGMVLWIELSRHVIEELPSRMTPFLGVHVTFSVATLVLYVVLIVTGVRNALGRTSWVHPRAAVAFGVARAGNLCTSLLL